MMEIGFVTITMGDLTNLVLREGHYNPGVERKSHQLGFSSITINHLYQPVEYDIPIRP